MNRLNQQPQPVQPMHGATPAAHDGRLPFTPKPGNLIRLPQVEIKTGLKKSTIYAGVKDKTFPSPVRLSARAVAWREENIDSWINARVTTGGQQ
ncbi:MAG: AlpA family transcriptional regulator [Rhodoferax sp.]|uniref:helix-turn-helix transcriptional regulator n=1 Tax=Rhodoferax sp. TaxID=50421 RepID=UPI003019AFA0